METETIKSFDELNISTITTMAYSNFNIDTKNLFHLLPITSTKVESEILKKKDIDKIKLQYGYGEIINISTKSCFRGLLLRRPKKKNCTICNPTKYKKIKKSIIEIFEDSFSEITIPSECGKILKIPVTKIMYRCSVCEKTYSPSDVKKINHFLNQMTIVMSLGVGKTPINIKIFHNGKFTITGCTEQDDAIEVMIILFKDLAPKLEKEYSIKLTAPFIKNTVEPKRFVFDTVMRNYDFKLGFVLNRNVLNNIMSNSEYDAFIKLSKYIPTDDTNVKIKMISKKFEDSGFETLIMDGVGDEISIDLENIKINPFCKPKKKVKEELDTFIVFSSSATIFSGRDIKSMEYNYNIFIDIIKKYKNEIEEK